MSEVRFGRWVQAEHQGFVLLGISQTLKVFPEMFGSFEQGLNGGNLGIVKLLGNLLCMEAFFGIRFNVHQKKLNTSVL